MKIDLSNGSLTLLNLPILRRQTGRRLIVVERNALRLIQDNKRAVAVVPEASEFWSSRQCLAEWGLAGRVRLIGLAADQWDRAEEFPFTFCEKWLVLNIWCDYKRIKDLWVGLKHFVKFCEIFLVWTLIIPSIGVWKHYSGLLLPWSKVWGVADRDFVVSSR